jgi:hypothetical protein
MLVEKTLWAFQKKKTEAADEGSEGCQTEGDEGVT